MQLKFVYLGQNLIDFQEKGNIFCKFKLFLFIYNMYFLEEQVEKKSLIFLVFFANPVNSSV